MKGNAWIFVVVGGLLIYWWFGVHVKASVTAGEDVSVTYRTDAATVPPAADPWMPAELGFLDLAAKLHYSSS